MELNLPILDKLATCDNILLAGAGGGFDIYAGLPIYFTLRALGKTLHVANYAFTDFLIVKEISETEILIPDVLQATYGAVEYNLGYLPEPYLAQWFQETHHERIPVWMLPNNGGHDLIQAYKRLIDHLQIDAIILVDGGVDSLMRGDEQGPGTLLDDTLSLIAADETDVPVQILACIGFGTEMEEAVCHHNALENMMTLSQAGAFMGACALTKEMEAFKQYEAACLYTWNQPNHHKSHISTRIIPAVHGTEIPELGFISPLMSLYWFFDARKVLAHSYIADSVRDTTTKLEAISKCNIRMRQLSRRPRRPIPY